MLELSDFDFVTVEHLFHMAMQIQSYEDFRMEGITGQIITLYAMDEIDPNAEGCTTEEITEKIKEYVVLFTLNELVKEGLLEESIDGRYSTTKLGSDWVQKNSGNNKTKTEE
jgi:predicted transcriptional regulator